ncbi:hypothetical protein Zm00014a_029132 [Zea mays]|uniref:Uncharacterized protein n=1 Tax=Zea mays TaxID=4577 RepID=A0A3L6EFX5_MAIZE|nr:hypothetical protein Zm00014a_029132 [Zea mays]
MRVPGCGRRGEAHRGNGHGGAPTAAVNRARNGGVYGGGALACAQRGRGGRGGGPVGAQMREGEMASKARGSSRRGRGGASPTRDVGAETAARTAAVTRRRRS